MQTDTHIIKTASTSPQQQNDADVFSPSSRYSLNRVIRRNGKQMVFDRTKIVVALALMRNGEQKVARAYVLYREQHAQKRAHEQVTEKQS